MFLFSPSLIFAQAGFALSWDSEVGCLEYGVDHKRIPFEEIGDNECLLACEGSMITFTVEYGDQEVSTIDWNTDGGEIYSISPSGETAVIAWPNIITNGNISIDIVLQNGQVYSRTMCVSVKAKPTGGFVIANENEESFCSENEIIFNNLAQAADGLQIVAAVWDFGDGNFSSEMNPIHIYNAPGNYLVSLTVYDECNCSNTWIDKVVVNDPSMSLSCPTVVCENDVVTYTVEGTVYTGGEIICSGYVWQVYGGHKIDEGAGWVDVVWDNPLEDGFGYVYFDQSNCDVECDNYLVAKVPVISENGIIKGGKTELCQGEQSKYSLPKWPTTQINWKLMYANNMSDVSDALVMVDQMNEIVVDAEFLPPGEYILIAKYKNTLLGCGGKAHFTFSVKENLTIDEELTTTEICEGNTAHFYLDQSVSGVTWTFSQNGQTIGTAYGSGSSGHAIYVFNTPGHYTVTAEANGYCKAFSHIKVIEVPDIAGAFITGVEEVCPGIGEEYVFNGDANGNEIHWWVDHGSFMGPNVGPSVMIDFASGYSNYVVSAHLVNPEFPDCKSDPITFDVDKFEPDAEIVQTTGSPEALCASSIESFSLNGYSGMEYYEWKIIPAELANIAGGHGTEHVDILFNEPFMGQNQGVISVSAKVCGTMQVIDQINFELVPSPGFAVTNAPTSTCPNTPIEIEVTMTGGPSIAASSLSIDFEGITASFPNVIETSPGVFKFQGIELPNINPNDNITLHYTVTADNASLCSVVQATGSIVLDPAPEIQIWLASGGQIFCTQQEINTQLSANIQGTGVDENDIQWLYMGSVVSTGPTYQPTNFGTYTAVATNTDDCTSVSNAITITQDCSGGSSTPCTGESVTLAGEWIECNVVEVTATFTGSPVAMNFVKLGSFTNLNAAPEPSSIVGNTCTQKFNVKSSGSYSFMFTADYSNCTLNSEPIWIDVDYHAIMYLDVGCEANAYEVSILNESTYMDGSNHSVSYSFIKEPSQVITPGYQDDNMAVATLGNGDYILGITLTAAGKPTCEVSENISLQLPDATFHFDDNPVCAEDPVDLEPDNPTPGASYLWKFQLATNTLQNISPHLSKSSELGDEIKLTVTDKYGCSKMHTENIVVNKADFDATLTTTPSTEFCEGEKVDLGYVSTSIPPPSAFQWNHNFNEIPNATNPTLLQIDQPGQYSLHLYDANGCVDLTAPSIFLTQILSPYLSAKITAAACEGDDIYLTGSISPEDAQYQISRKKNSGNYTVVQPWTTGFTIDFTDTGLDVASYTYKVEVKDLETSCTYEEEFTAIVYPTPEVVITYDVDCGSPGHPYTIELKASTNINGTYTWSNGMSGPVIHVDHGGAYQVTFSPEGSECYVTAMVEAPKSPEEFIWVFPTGCFEYCDIMLYEPYIHGGLGPTPPNYGGYAYELDNVFQAGSIVYPIHTLLVPPMEGSLNFTLDNSYCDITSNDLHLTRAECRDCELDIVIIKEIIEIRDEEEGSYFQIVEGAITNPYYDIFISVVLTSPQGVFSPSVIMIPPEGTYEFNLNPIDFIPYNINVQDIEIQVQVYGNPGHGSIILCSDIFTIRIQEFIYHYKTGAPQMLMLVNPNPVLNHAEVIYEVDITQNFAGGIINMYSLSGKLIKTLKVNKAYGSQSFDTSHLASGAYIVIFMYEGSRIGQQILIKQ